MRASVAMGQLSDVYKEAADVLQPYVEMSRVS